MARLKAAGAGAAAAGAAGQPSKRLPVNPRRHKVAPENRKRVPTACNACNVRRVKCSGERPCFQCQSSSRECIYPVAVEKVSVSRAELDELKRKIDLYERALQDTVPDATRRHELLQRSALVLQPQSTQTSAGPDAEPVDPSRAWHLPQPRHGHLDVSEQGHDVPVSTEGRLLNDPDGHARFMGETSGATFLDYLKEFMSTVLPLAYKGYHTATDGSSFLSSLGSYQTYDSRPLHETDVDPTWLPPSARCEAMLSELRFFIQDGNGSWPSGGIYWWGDLDIMPAVPQAASSSIVYLDKCRHLAFYDAAFAIVCQASVVEEQTAGAEGQLSASFYTRARSLLGNPLDITRFTVNDVAAITLMGFYLIEMNRRDAACMCVSNAMQISVMHGAHRGWVDERGKRVFWTLYILDRWLSCLMGRPPAIMDEAIRLPLPCDTPGMPSAAGLKAHVELARISGHIVCNVYRISSRDRATDASIHVERAISLLEAWKSALPPRLQPIENGLSDDPACCLLHMNYNQLVILTIRPLFFAAVKKLFAERLVTRQSSLDSHPQLAQLRRCVTAAELNIRLARHVLALNHPRKLLQAGLHFIFNAATCLMLQELVHTHGIMPRDRRHLDSDLNFVIARFDEESRTGSAYGRDCANILRDLRSLVQRLTVPVTPNLQSSHINHVGDGGASMRPENQSELETRSWLQKIDAEGLPQQVHVEQGHVLYDELVSWMDDEWHSYDGYMI